MGNIANPITVQPAASPKARRQPSARPAPRPWSGDDVVVTAFAFLGIGGGVFLPMRFGLPTITTSILLATGIAALAYRFLGGVEGSTVTVGAVKLTGAVAVLVGIALLIYSRLPCYQVWEVSGQVLDEKGQPFNYDPQHLTSIELQPPMPQPPSAQGKFSIQIISRPDDNKNGVQKFPTLSVSRDGYKSSYVDLNPKVKNDIALHWQGQEIEMDPLKLQLLPPYQP